MPDPLFAVRSLGVAPIDPARAAAAHAAMANDGEGGALAALAGEMAGASPFLARLLEREADWLRSVAGKPPRAALYASLRSLDAVATDAPEQEVAAALRDVRERVALLVALADCGGLWGVEAVTRALSDHADASCRLAWRWGEAEAVRRRQLPAEPDARGRGFLLALGKGGARELNYSSDIDVVAFYERPAEEDPRRDLTAGWVAVARAVTRLLGAPEGGRIAHRVDWRLRPDPGATPLAIPTAAALRYYGEQARSWERLAFIKARPVAGDVDAGAAFLAELEPFVWRRTLDFSVGAEMVRMAERIRAAKGQGVGPDLDGWDIKTGRGGIREIEFLVQSQQTIRGGREPALRAPATLDALGALAGAGAITRSDADALEGSYRHHRTLEHRLQMIEDRQTQAFPPVGAARERLAALMGGSLEALVRATQRHRDNVAALFDRIMEPALPRGAAARGPVHEALDLLDAPEGDGRHDRAAAALGALGFGNGEAAGAILLGWLAARPPALRSAPAREAMEAVLPDLVGAVAGARDPLRALRTLDRMVTTAPSGLQLFSLLRARPALCALLARILSDAPHVAESVARDAAVLAGAGEPGFWQSPDASEVAASVRGIARARGGLEATMDAVRIVHRTEQFRLSLRLLEGLDARVAGRDASVVVEAGLHALWEAACRERGVEPDRSGLAVVAMGRFGARETTAQSDLDLLVIGRDAETSERGTRVVRTLVAAIGSPTAEGRFREVDMRLRPSGRAGPLVTTLEGFRRHHEAAEAWELVALGRARPVAGDPALLRGVADALAAIRTTPHDADALLRGGREVLERVRAERPPLGALDVKNREGGLFAIEYAVHLAHALRPDPRRAGETGTAALIALLSVAPSLRDELAAVHAALSGALQMLAALGDGMGAAKAPPSLDAAMGGDAARAIEAWLARGEGATALLWDAMA